MGMNVCNKNLIMYGIEQGEKSFKELCIKVNEIMKKAEIVIPEVAVIEIRRLGMIKSDETRPNIIKFIAPRYKFLIFEKDEKLKTVGISVASDMPKERRVLKSKLLKARNLLKQKNKQAIIRVFDLIVDDCHLSIEEIEKIISKEEFSVEDNNNNEKTSSQSYSSSSSVKKNEKYKINFPVIKTVSAKVNRPKPVVNTRRNAKVKQQNKKRLHLDTLQPIRIIFWNIRGLANYQDIQSQINENTIVCLRETWCTNDVKIRVSKSKYSQELIATPAVKKGVKGRAMGGLLMCLNKNYYKSELLIKSKDYIICKVKFLSVIFIIGVAYISPLVARYFTSIK